MKHVCRAGVAMAALLLVAQPLAAQNGGGAGLLPFEKYTLDNGLEVILSEDHSVPVVSVDVWYRVGAANEQPGRTGFAHLFEHMMFQGSENVARGDHFKLLERAGSAQFNGTTGNERTNYYESLPANRLNLGLWLEADRMRSLAITKENLDNQREVVREEKRMRFDNQPYFGAIRAAIAEYVYNPETCFGFGHPSIGSMEDLGAASVEDVQTFFDIYYAPSNATLTVAGDFDPAETKRMIEEYFGDIPRGGELPAVTCEQPFSALPETRTVQDANANLPAVFYSYGFPASQDGDIAPLRLLASILGDGESARLNQRLVRDEQALLQVIGLPDLRRGPSVYLIGGFVNQGVSVDRVQTLLDGEMERIRNEGVTEAELTRAKNQFRSQTLRTLQTAFGKAEALQSGNFFVGEPAAVENDLEQNAAVTVEDIRRVANEYLVPNNRAVTIVQPATAAATESNR